MLKHPEAAYITQAGRGYFQVGSDEIFEEFQSGWSGARYEPDVPYADERSAEVTMINLWGRASVLSVGKKEDKSAEEKVIQLDAVTDYIAQVAEDHGIKAISNVWLPPLPKMLYLDELPEMKLDERELTVPVGLLDDPVNQEQRAVAINFTQNNHTMVASSTSGGKTSFVQTVLYGLVTTKTPDQLQIYIADFGSRTLGVFGALPHVGGVVFDDDPDRVDKLISLLMKELGKRKLSFSSKNIGSFKEYSKLFDDVPAILLVIDNLPAYMENNPKQEENMLQLVREAASYGIYLLVTCTNLNDVRSKIRQNIRFGIGLQLPEKYDYDEVLGNRGDITAEDGCPGRGLIKVESSDQKEPRSLEFQAALCIRTKDTAMINTALKEVFQSMADKWEGALAQRIPQVPNDLSFEAFKNYPETQQALRAGLLPIGYDVHEAELITLDPEDIFCYVISGGARTGKTTAMRLVALTSAACGHDVHIIDTSGQLSPLAAEHDMTCLVTADQIFDWLSQTIIPEFKRRNDNIKNAGGRKFCKAAQANEKQIIILIHDFGGFLNTVYSDTRDMWSFLETMVKMGSGHKICIMAVLTRDDSASHSIRPIYTGFTGWKEGIHLGGNTDNQRILDFDMSPSERMKKQRAGKGHTVINGRTVEIVMPEA